MDKTNKKPESLFKMANELTAMLSLCGFMEDRSIPIPSKIYYLMSDLASKLSNELDDMLDSNFKDNERSANDK